MNQRLTRKDIKRDEFVTAMGRGVEYAESHARLLMTAIGGALLLALLILAIVLYRGNRRQAANEALARAIKVHEAPIAATGAKPDDPTAPTFPDESARRTRAKALFTEVQDDYGSTAAGKVAGLYLAQMAVQDGQPDRARELWNDFLDDHGDHMLAGGVRLSLFHLDRQQGKAEQVAQELEGMVDKADAPLPQDVVLYELGQTREQLGKTADAIQSYQRIVDEFPQSPYASEARQRMTALDPSRGVTGGIGGIGGLSGIPGVTGIPGQ